MRFFGAIGDATSSTSEPDSADPSLPFLCFNKIRKYSLIVEQDGSTTLDVQACSLKLHLDAVA
jgi:hypothetical protein